MEKEIEMHGNKVYGETVSEYGLKKGYLDYLALSKIVGDMILNNNLINETDIWEWASVTDNYDEEIYQYYIISEWGSDFLTKNTDEIVLYNENLDIYLWGITHWGTSWDYVLTDIKLVPKELY